MSIPPAAGKFSTEAVAPLDIVDRAALAPMLTRSQKKAHAILSQYWEWCCLLISSVE